MMKILTTTAVFALIVAAPALAAQQNETPQQSAQRLCQEWTQAFNSKDANQITSMFTQDGIDVTPQNINQGQNQIRSRIEENLRTMTNFRCTVDRAEGINSQGQVVNGQGQLIQSSNQSSSSSSTSSSQSSSSQQGPLFWAVGTWGVQNRNQQTNRQEPVDGFWSALYQVQEQNGSTSSRSSNSGNDIRIRMLSYNQRQDQNSPVGSSSSQQNR